METVGTVQKTGPEQAYQGQGAAVAEVLPRLGTYRQYEDLSSTHSQTVCLEGCWLQGPAHSSAYQWKEST